MAKEKGMKEILLKIIDFLGLAWWVEIVTDAPHCTYYFGPFIDKKEAEDAKAGYLEDLHGEGSQNIVVRIKRCKPDNLTVFEDLEERTTIQAIHSFNS